LLSRVAGQQVDEFDDVVEAARHTKPIGPNAQNDIGKRPAAAAAGLEEQI
jgi:hypothetical protein